MRIHVMCRLFTNFIFVCALIHSNRGDLPVCKQVKAQVYIDGTGRFGSVALQQLPQILQYFTERLPARSEVQISIIHGQSIEKIESVTLPDPDSDSRLSAIILDKLNSASSPLSSERNGEISSEAVDRDALAYFSFGKYKTVSELVFLFVSSLSRIDRLPKSLSKKKTSVVYFGDSLSELWKTIASREDHQFVVSGTTDLQNISERLINITCEDSDLYCDTDQYSTMPGSACKLCANNICRREDSLTCQHRCPYYKKQLTPEAAVNVRLNVTNDNKQRPSGKVIIEDHQQAIWKTVLVVAVGIFATPAIAVGALFVYKRLKPQQMAPHHDIERHEIPQRDGGRDNVDMPLVIPESEAQQESLGASGSRPNHGLTDEEHAMSLLKNGHELELNVLATGQPPIHDVQCGK